jgi:hypothetical protein
MTFATRHIRVRRGIEVDAFMTLEAIDLLGLGSTQKQENHRGDENPGYESQFDARAHVAVP